MRRHTLVLVVSLVGGFATAVIVAWGSLAVLPLHDCWEVISPADPSLIFTHLRVIDFGAEGRSFGVSVWDATAIRPSGSIATVSF